MSPLECQRYLATVVCDGQIRQLAFDTLACKIGTPGSAQVAHHLTLPIWCCLDANTPDLTSICFNKHDAQVPRKVKTVKLTSFKTSVVG